MKRIDCYWGNAEGCVICNYALEFYELLLPSIQKSLKFGWVGFLIEKSKYKRLWFWWDLLSFDYVKFDVNGSAKILAYIAKDEALLHRYANYNLTSSFASYSPNHNFSLLETTFFFLIKIKLLSAWQRWLWMGHCHTMTHSVNQWADEVGIGVSK